MSWHSIALIFNNVNATDDVIFSPISTIYAHNLTIKSLFAILVSIIMTTKNDQNLIEDLKLIGLPKKEAAVYLACLELGTSSVWDISQRSGVKRPTCYVLLDNLISQGFASKTEDKRRTLYSVLSPEELLAAFERRKAIFAKEITQLQAVASKSSQKPKVRLYEGARGVEQVYELTLERPNSEILIYGTASVVLLYKEFIDRYLARRVNRGIKARVILPDTEENRAITNNDKDELRETRFLPREKFDQKTEVNIYGDSIAYIAHSEKEPFATVIENSTLAEEERNRFELLWQVSLNKTNSNYEL